MSPKRDQACIDCPRDGEECEGCEEGSASERIQVFTANMTEEERLLFYEGLLETEGLAPI